ncbi:hypothetical protein [Rhizobium leguminosarum]|uniref:hypothetical protein n=1 Tax=Rhizobium leguminosarum TaxID=384 RepID=UPI0013F20DD2|nr:hypothetical protein [Rhizobium leguminosarum]
MKLIYGSVGVRMPDILSVLRRVPCADQTGKPKDLPMDSNARAADHPSTGEHC